jgi:hypothetical protein
MNWLHRAAFAVVLGTRAIFAVAADAPTTAPVTMPSLDKQTSALIDQLDADDYHTRQSAADQLAAIGEPIRPAIVALAALGKTPEQQSSAAAILARLDKIIADRPTLITLHVKEANPREVFAEIAKQAHTDLPIWPEQLWTDNRFGNIPKITLDIDQQPFWLALAQACQSASVHVQNMGNNQTMTIMQGSNNDMLVGPRCMSGLFIIVADSAARNHAISFARGQSATNIDDIEFHLYVDPKARLVETHNPATLTLAEDDKGNSLIATAAVSRFRSASQGSSVTFSAPLHYPNDGYTKITKLKGTLEATMAAKTQTLEIPDMAAAINTTHPVGHWTVDVQDFRLNGNSGSFSLKIHTGGTSVNQMFYAERSIQLIDATGRNLVNGGGGGGNDTEVQYSSSFSTSDPIKSPVKLVWNVVTETKQQSIPFEFTDLPLPSP